MKANQNTGTLERVQKGMKTNENKMYLFAAFAGTVAVLGLTLLIYATFFHEFLEQFTELSPNVVEMISRENVNLVTILLANLAHGFLIATVIRWGKFHTPLRGAGAGAVIAFLTEIYFCFSQYSLFKTMSLPSAILDTLMWTFINAIVGALVAYIIGRGVAKDEKIAASPQH